MIGSRQWVFFNQTETMKTKLDALDQAIALIGSTDRGKMDNEFTVKEYAERSGVPINSAKEILAKKAKEGVLNKRKGILAGSRTNFYSIP
jgi:hypothetical protein